jgi:NADH:ubiquinone oxidoreductase subunit 5 (subunit L)/multisubunit Na+/H+ antiporter MnhA subunit
MWLYDYMLYIVRRARTLLKKAINKIMNSKIVKKLVFKIKKWIKASWEALKQFFIYILFELLPRFIKWLKSTRIFKFLLVIWNFLKKVVKFLIRTLTINNLRTLIMRLVNFLKKFALRVADFWKNNKKNIFILNMYTMVTYLVFFLFCLFLYVEGIIPESWLNDKDFFMLLQVAFCVLLGILGFWYSLYKILVFVINSIIYLILLFRYIIFEILQLNFDVLWYDFINFLTRMLEYLPDTSLPVFFFGFTLFLSSTLISLFFLSHLGLYGVFVFNLITIVIFWLTTILYFDSFFYENMFYKISVGKWFTILNGVDVFFEFYVDSISYSFMLLTVTIATAVYVYVYSYFRYEPNIERLSLLINLFVISMVILVMSGNFFVLFFGWEMIGITSFLLINFWSTKISSLKSAFKAFTFNKFSDLCLFLAVIYSFILINDSSIIVFNFQIIEYMNYYIVTPWFKIQMIELLSFLFITAAFVKSAQFGFHIWLPDSMDAPVPASALIHSATLVSAGVFILLRLTVLFELSIYATYIIPLIGSFTAFVGGLGAVYQSDIKRILAYSTISHCGFLMVCFSLHVPEYTILYLYIHGFFKAAVFLCAGNIIRFSRNYQDFRKMGSLWKYLPFEFYASFICLSNLCGLPFTLGFYIKHLILVVLNNDSVQTLFVLVNIFSAAIFGLIYSYKFFYYIFLDKKKTNKYVYNEVNRFNLSSKFYSNTTLAPICSITFLIICSFVISLLLFNCFLKKNSIGESLDVNIFYNFSYLELNWPSKNLLNNVGYFNWLIIITIISLFINYWRVSFKSSDSLFNLNFISLVLIFIYIFVILIN